MAIYLAENIEEAKLTFFYVGHFQISAALGKFPFTLGCFYFIYTQWGLFKYCVKAAALLALLTIDIRRYDIISMS